MLMKKLRTYIKKSAAIKVFSLSTVFYLASTVSLPAANNSFTVLGTIPAKAASSVHVKFKTYQKDSKNNWKLLLSTSAVVGKKGVNANRHEGDLTTPEGIYGFLFAFGRTSNPGTKMEYRKTHSGDYWVSTRNKLYNTWVKYSGNGTAGCIAISEKNLINVLKWMNPNKNPKIIIGTKAYLQKLAKH